MANLIDRLVGLLAPFECMNCQSEGLMLCKLCRQLLLPIPPRCFDCRKVSDDYRVCTKCRHTSQLYSVYVGTIYQGFAKDMVWRLKYWSAKAISIEMAQIMANKLSSLDDQTIVVPVPTTTKRTRQRGYDQAKLIAKEISRQTNLPYLDCISRQGVAHQVGSSRQVRKKQLESAFRIKSNIHIRGRDILIIDDVLTTGATLESAAKTLKKHGARRVSAAIFAQTD